MKSNVLALVIAAAAAVLAPAAAHAVPADWPKELRIGLIPTESSSHITDRYDALAKYLEKRLGIPVKLETSTDYNGVITAMQFKHVEVAYFGPKSYVEAAARADADAFAMEVLEDGTQGYHGIIITRKDSGLKSVADLKGKTWAFTDPNSTSGTLVPTVFFVKELKVDPDKYFSKVSFSGSHEASILSVVGGKVDAASTNDLDFDRGAGKLWNKDDFQVIWTSKLIPGSPMAYRKDLPASLKVALREAFTKLSDPAVLGPLKLKSYTATTDATYDPIREQIEVKKMLEAAKK
jgi:phosphonate transport system substrate-binding protein